jgi:hypothetical protein
MSGLILFECARDALAECKSIDEVKDWSDRAAATQAYAKMAKDKSLEVDAAEIRIRAERRLGEMLAEQKATHGLNQGAKGIGTSAVPSGNRTPTLAEVGIDKKLSARAQKIAAVPKAEFEAEVGEWRERVEAEGARVTARLETSGAKHQQAEAEPEAESDDDRTADLLADAEAAFRIIEADDKLSAAWDECKTLSRKLEQLDGLYKATYAELATMTREAKRWKRKAEALEKGRAA